MTCFGFTHLYRLEKIILLCAAGYFFSGFHTVAAQSRVITGADRMEAFLPLLKNKKVAVLVNQTSRINGVLLPDTLLHRGVAVTAIFAPEHGFRGDADAGAQVENSRDAQTGLPVYSLYGARKKPTSEQLSHIDVVVYDIQDVGVRFYTYISTLQYLMEACGENHKPLIILDRPDPLGFIVDGPVLDTAFRSFVGMQPIPVIYGMTPGEYAGMLSGEKWLNAPAPEVTVIPCKNYTHAVHYDLPVPPSPNLKNMAAVYLYPSLCLLEGTVISVGRGTDAPFQQYGHPDLQDQPDGFTPQSMNGAVNPPLKGLYCHGRKIADDSRTALEAADTSFSLKWLLDAWCHFPDKNAFFNNFFNTLAGNNTLQEQIRNGLPEQAIRDSWQPQLVKFKQIRARYLLYQ